MLNWLKEHRLSNLREQLAVVQASIRHEAEQRKQTGHYYPVVDALNVKEQARLLFRIAEIEKTL